MIDIHCHTLFGVDDGPRSLAESIAMLRIARENRITDIILTPHYRGGMFPYPHDRIEASFDALEQEAKRLSIRLHPGCEYYADHDMVENFRSGYCMTLAGGAYVLVEFGTHSSLMDIRSATESLLAAGYKPVIAHAERYEVFRKNPEALAGFRSGGVMIQLNADSILGKEGRQAKAVTAGILREDNADIIASDAHNTKKRRCRLKECRLYIAQKYGRDTAKRLFHENPARVLMNA